MTARPLPRTHADAEHALRRFRPRTIRRAHLRAAVAILLRETVSGLSVLLIERATRPGGRWSGDVAFPGGLTEPHDQSADHTARRELQEEVGLTAGPRIGQLSDVASISPHGLRRMAITPIVYAATDPGRPTVESAEVAAVSWVPLSALRSKRRWALRRIGRVYLPFPEREVGGRRLWGLTLGMAEELARVLERRR